MLEPTNIRKKGNTYIVSEPGFDFIFSGIRIKGSSIHCHLKIVDTETNKVLFISNIDPMDPNIRWRIAQHLSILEENKPWLEWLTLTSTIVVNELLAQDEPKKLREVSAREHYFIKPIIADPYTLIFAPGGSGKSYLALLIAIAAQNGISFGVFDFRGFDKINVLYLDWETSEDDISRRFTLLKHGMGVEDLESPDYRNLSLPLEYEFDKILDDIVEKDIKLLIVDSVVPAIGGDIIRADVVGEFFSILRQFYSTNGTRTLLLTHISKQSKREDDEKSPIGSIYFENYPRLVWELKSISLRDKLQIELKPYKYNISRPESLSFLFSFRLDAVDVLTTEIVEETDDLKEFIVQVLENEGIMKVKDLMSKIKSQFGYTEKTIRKKLEEYKRAGVIKSMKYGEIGLPEMEENNDEPPF